MDGHITPFLQHFHILFDVVLCLLNCLLIVKGDDIMLSVCGLTNTFCRSEQKCSQRTYQVIFCGIYCSTEKNERGAKIAAINI
jgi:hypothetical protein